MPSFLPQTGDTIIQLYNNFITDFETKINLLKLAHFAVIASRQYPDKDAAISFLEGVITKLRETRESRMNEPILYVKMQIAAINLEKGNQKECKNLVEEGKTTLDSMTDVGPTVHASFYWISSQYHKARQEFAEFYKNALLYLAYTTVESLSESFKLVCFIHQNVVYHKKNHSVAFKLWFIDYVLSCQDLAFDLSLSALLGDNIYNFGELLSHPIVSSTLFLHDLLYSHPYSSCIVVFFRWHPFHFVLLLLFYSFIHKYQQHTYLIISVKCMSLCAQLLVRQ